MHTNETGIVSMTAMFAHSVGDAPNCGPSIVTNTWSIPAVMHAVVMVTILNSPNFFDTLRHQSYTEYRFC